MKDSVSINEGDSENIEFVFNLSDYSADIDTDDDFAIFNDQLLLLFNPFISNYADLKTKALDGQKKGVLDNLDPFGRYITLTDGNWHMIASVRQGTTHTIYGDGATNNTSGTVGATALDATTFAFGLNRSTTVNGDAFAGNIATTQIYNRALSAAEIQQNYNALKSRFGL